MGSFLGNNFHSTQYITYVKEKSLGLYTESRIQRQTFLSRTLEGNSMLCFHHFGYSTLHFCRNSIRLLSLIRILGNEATDLISESMSQWMRFLNNIPRITRAYRDVTWSSLFKGSCSHITHNERIIFLTKFILKKIWYVCHLRRGYHQYVCKLYCIRRQGYRSERIMGYFYLILLSEVCAMMDNLLNTISCHPVGSWLVSVSGSSVGAICSACREFFSSLSS